MVVTKGRTVLVALQHEVGGDLREHPAVVTFVEEGSWSDDDIIDVYVFPNRYLPTGAILGGIGVSKTGEPELTRWRFPPR